MADKTFRVVRLTDKAIAPIRSSAKAAGYDLASAYDYLVPAGGKCLCKTDLQIAVPDGCYGRVAPRSGLANKYMIDTGAGVIDADYRGNVGVILFNHGKEDFKVQAGDRIAQLILERIETPEVVVVASLDETERGANGFGSTGLRESGDMNKEQPTTVNLKSPMKKFKPEAGKGDKAEVAE